MPEKRSLGYQVRHKPVYAVSEKGQKLKILYLSGKGIGTIRVAKTKVLISCAVTAQLICVFVFA